MHHWIVKNFHKINYKSYSNEGPYKNKLHNLVIVALPNVAMDDVIHILIFGLKPYLKGFVNAQVQVISDELLTKIITVELKLEENI